jgi:hypothetical protein
MTLPVQSYSVSYNGNGSQVNFAITQTYWSAGQIKVYLRDENADPITETLWVDGVDYNIVGPNVVAVAAPIVGEKVVILRELDIEQELDLIAAGVFPVEQVESTLDKIVAICQQLKGGIDRAYLAAITSGGSGGITFPAPESNKVIGWNAGATALENKDNQVGLTASTVVPAGLVNGVNAVFTIPNTPQSGWFFLFKNGRFVKPSEYGLVGTTITMTTAPLPGEELDCVFWY